MNSLATKLAFSALVVATLATPAFAQRLSQQAQPQDYYRQPGRALPERRGAHRNCRLLPVRRRCSTKATKHSTSLTFE